MKSEQKRWWHNCAQLLSASRRLTHEVRGHIRLYLFQELLVHFWCAGCNVPGFQIIITAGQRADPASGLDDQKCARRDVPLLETQFPETVKSARRNIGQIEGGGAWPPDASHLA